MAHLEALFHASGNNDERGAAAGQLAESFGFLDVELAEGKPLTPVLTLRRVGTREVEVTWKGFPVGSVVTAMRLQAMPLRPGFPNGFDPDIGVELGIAEPIADTSATLRGLTPGHTYLCRLVAVNDAGARIGDETRVTTAKDQVKQGEMSAWFSLLPRRHSLVATMRTLVHAPSITETWCVLELDQLLIYSEVCSCCLPLLSRGHGCDAVDVWACATAVKACHRNLFE
jgi:hypothetical protein